MLNNSWDLYYWFDCDTVLPRYKIWNQYDKFKLSIRAVGTETVIAPVLRHMSIKRTYAVLLNSSPGSFTVAVRATSIRRYPSDSRLASLHSAYPNATNSLAPSPAHKQTPFTSHSIHSAVTVPTEAPRLKLADSRHTTKDLRNMPTAAVQFLLRLYILYS